MGNEGKFGLPGFGGRHRRRSTGDRLLSPGHFVEPTGEQSFLHALEENRVTNWAEARVYPAGTVLLSEGETASNDVFVIKSGWAKIGLEMGGREEIIAVRGRGDIIGERAVRTKSARSATVTALDDVRVWVLPGTWFTSFLATHPAARKAIERLEEEREYEVKSRWDAPEPIWTSWHLAELILRLARRCGWDERDSAATIKLPMSAAELASWANADPDAVAGYLRSWRGLGIVAGDGRQAVVILLAKLRLFHAAGFLPMWTAPNRRPLWQAFTDGVGGIFDLFGQTRPTRPAVSAFGTTLADEARVLCLVLGLLPGDDKGGQEG